MAEEPETNIVDEVQNIAGDLTGVSNNENEEEEKNDGENQNEEEEEHADGDHPTNDNNEEEDNEKGKLEETVGDTTNKLLPNEVEEEAKQEEESVAISEPKTSSQTGSRRPRRNKNKPIDQDIEVVIPDLPFAPQPKDPNIVHYIFEYDDEGTRRNTTRNGNTTYSARSKYQSAAQRGAPPSNGGSLYDNSPYFSKPFTIYKVPIMPRTTRPNKTLSSRSRSTGRSMNSTQKSNYSNTNSINGYESNRSNYMSYSKRYSTRPPPPSNYVERTKEFDERQRRYDTEFTERYKLAHPLPIYQPHYQKTVLEMKIEKQRREERKYRKAAEEAKKRRIQNRKNHEEFIKKTENFENEGEKKPKYLENLSQKKDYFDLDYDLSEEDQNEKQSRSQSKQTKSTENQSQKGRLENQLDDNTNALLGNTEKTNNEEEEESHEKLDNEEEDQNDAGKKEEEEEKKDEEEEKKEEEN